MVDQHHRAAFVAKTADQVGEDVDLAARQASEGFVNQHHLRITRDRFRKLEPAQVGKGQRRRAAIHDGAQTDAVGNPFGALDQRLVREQHEQAVRQQRHHDVLQHRLPVQRPRVLEHHAKALARDLVRGKAGDVLAFEDHFAGGRALDAHHALHRGRLARAVRPDEAKNLAAIDLEAEVLHRRQSAEALGQATDFQYGPV
ncbi:hypothetical protein ACVWYI_006493 [Bradyrhizobium sp. LB13.1]